MSSLQQSTNAFDALPIRQAVFRQTFPAIASQMITLIYNLADTYFVGMLNQPSQTAAITVVYSSYLQPVWRGRRQRLGPGTGAEGPR